MQCVELLLLLVQRPLQTVDPTQADDGDQEGCPTQHHFKRRTQKTDVPRSQHEAPCLGKDYASSTWPVQ
jgi:hypothetical protein